MEVFNEHVSTHTVAARFALMVVCLTLLTAMASAKLRTATFVLQSTTVKKLCGTQNIITVNGQFPGPTIHARNGDTVIVKVYNNAQYNATIHWHGVRQFRTGWSDGPEFITQCPIRPGGSYTYKFTLTDQEGTLWWHGHSSWLRATVYGALIISPRLGSTYPYTKPHGQVPILLGEWWNRNPIDVVNQATQTGAAPSVSDAFTINGRPGDLYQCSSSDTLHISVKNGETKLLRVINAALNTDLFFSVSSHTMTVVAVDALYTKPFQTNVLMLGPGQTTDVLVTADQSIGRYYMAARAYSSGQGVPFDNTTTVAILEYEGSSSTTSNPNMPNLPFYNDTQSATSFANGLRSLASNDHPVFVPRSVDKNLLYTIGLGLINCPGQSCGGPNGSRFAASMNNISFVLPTTSSILQAQHFGVKGVFSGDFPDNPPVQFDYTAQNVNRGLWSTVKGTKVKVLNYNTTVQVILQGTNIFAGESHPIHLHGYDFYIVGTGFGNYSPQNDPQKFNLVDPPMRNTVNVPVNGWAAIRFVADNPGAWLMHCHLDAHITWGLAMVFLVNNGPNSLLSLESPPVDLPQC
uniref:Laccase n=1 Tax=Picea abies TaxID=3329 RepID=K4NZE7_PICAB|nr:laccase [Picea abies]